MPAAKKLSDAEVHERLTHTRGWTLTNGKLHRSFECKDFVNAFGNMTRVALVAEAMSYNASLQYLVRKAWYDLIAAAPFATIGTVVWIVIAYYFHQSMIGAVTRGRKPGRFARKFHCHAGPMQRTCKEIVRAEIAHEFFE